MKCPRCGHWNKDTFPRCFKCGEPLRSPEGDEAPQAPSWQAQFAAPQPKKRRFVYDDTVNPVEDVSIDVEGDEHTPQKRNETPLPEDMVRLKERRDRGEKLLAEFRQNAASQGIVPSTRGVTVGRSNVVYSDMLDDPEVTVHVAGVENDGSVSRRRKRATQHAYNPALDVTADPYRTISPQHTARVSTVAEDAYSLYDVDLPPPPEAQPSIAPAEKKRRRIRGPMVLAYSVVCVLVLAVAAFLAYAVTSALVPSLSTIQSAADKIENVSIDTIDMDGLAGHRIQIPGTEGAQIYISELLRSYVVVNGVATIEVADYVFYESIDPLEISSMEVSLTPTTSYNGTEKRAEPIRYTINIPESEIELLSPEAEKVEVHTSVYNMRLQVAPGSMVRINGVDLSDTVNENGIVNFNPPVQAIGNNEISIMVRAPYCRASSMTVTLYRAPMEIPLELNAATLMNTTDEKLTIHATTQIGANVTVESPHFELNTADIENTGKFYVAAKMTRVGTNTVVIRASYPGKKDSIIEHKVEYLPPAEVYTPKAWALNSSDYSELMNNIALRIDNAQIYLCQGVIKEILSSNPQLAIMDTGASGREQLVLLQNASKTTWVEGTSYRVYADVSGVYNNMPRLTGRYTYGIEK